jgi:hypothetical protein
VKRLPELLLVAAIVLTGIALFLAGRATAAEDGVAIPVDCGQTVCVLPKRIWEALIEGHNLAIDENRRMKAELEKVGRDAPKVQPPCVMPRGVKS